MYQTIYVPVDNSEHSNRAIATSARLGKAFEAKLVGSHVYAARMHDYRFKQMEFTLPEEYLEEAELARQRNIHDNLITMGLELISDCYLDNMDQICRSEGLTFEKRMMDGKHTVEILRDIAGSDYDLVVLGALGIGRSRDAQLGSVCQRVTREVDRDVWVVKHLPRNGDVEGDTILVGVDGSPEGFGALMTAVELAGKLEKKIELISVYDPYLHYAVFKGIVEVLTERAAKVFRFEEQNQLHEEIIDTGLADIYQAHLNVAESMARDTGLEVTKTLLDGKVFQKVIDHARKTRPFLIVIGRTGIHHEGGELLGSNTENILRLATCDVLLTTRKVTPTLDLKAEESIHWSPEAEERLKRAPEGVRGMARTAILRLALEHGHSVVTSDLVTEAMDRFMPKASQRHTRRLAEALALEKVRENSVSICKHCSTVALVPDPVQCASCGGKDFELLSPEMVGKVAEEEGGVEEEITYDGRKLKWTQEARKALRALGDNYQRRRAKARIEKDARRKRLDTVTLELAKGFIEEETGVLYRAAVGDEGKSAADLRREAAAEAGGQAAAVLVEQAEDPELRLLARDKKNNPLFSRWDWTDEAIARVLRVPAGFMRNRTQARIEELASERGAAQIDLALVEDGIRFGLQMMKDMFATYGGASPEMKAADAAVQAGPKAETPAASECPVPPEAGGPAGKTGKGPALNEISIMSELDRQRQGLRSNNDA